MLVGEWGEGGGGSPKEMLNQMEGSISRGGLPGGGDRKDCILTELPHCTTPEYPITTLLSQRFIYEYTLRRSHLCSRLPTTGAASIAMD